MVFTGLSVQENICCVNLSDLRPWTPASMVGNGNSRITYNLVKNTVEYLVEKVSILYIPTVSGSRIVIIRLFFQKVDFISWIFLLLSLAHAVTTWQKTQTWCCFFLLHKKNSFLYLTTLLLNMSFFLRYKKKKSCNTLWWCKVTAACMISKSY